MGVMLPAMVCFDRQGLEMVLQGNLLHGLSGFLDALGEFLQKRILHRNLPYLFLLSSGDFHLFLFKVVLHEEFESGVYWEKLLYSCLDNLLRLPIQTQVVIVRIPEIRLS